VIAGVVLHLPMFLGARDIGRVTEARAIMGRFGARLVAAGRDEPEGQEREGRYAQLSRSPLGRVTVCVALATLTIAPPSLRGAALLGALPVALAALAVGRFGIETRRRGLEEITAVELPKALEAR
jgi:hypothetical protein